MELIIYRKIVTKLDLIRMGNQNCQRYVKHEDELLHGERGD